jgi:hypothetical protein
MVGLLDRGVSILPGVPVDNHGLMGNLYSIYEERKNGHELQKYWHDMVMGKKKPELALIFHNKCWDAFMNYCGPGTMGLKFERIFAICKYIEPPRRNGILESVGWPFEIYCNGMGIDNKRIDNKTQFAREKDLLVFHLTGSGNPHIQKYSLENSVGDLPNYPRLRVLSREVPRGVSLQVRA